MKKYIYYTFLIFNIGIIYMIAKGVMILPTAFTHLEHSFYQPIYELVKFIIPIELGQPYIFIANMITLNILLGILCLLLFPFIALLNTSKRRN